MKYSNINKLFVMFIALVIIDASYSLPSYAATSSTTLPVTATVRSTCNISADTLAFGNHTGTQVDSNATITVTCTNSTAYNVGLSEGAATGAAVTTRQMTAGAAVLNYSLFQNSSRTLERGKTVATDTIAATGNGSAQSLTVYGWLAPSQFVDPASHTDTITATVTY